MSSRAMANAIIRAYLHGKITHLNNHNFPDGKVVQTMDLVWNLSCQFPIPTEMRGMPNTIISVRTCSQNLKGQDIGGTPIVDLDRLPSGMISWISTNAHELILFQRQEDQWFMVILTDTKSTRDERRRKRLKEQLKSEKEEMREHLKWHTIKMILKATSVHHIRHALWQYYKGAGIAISKKRFERIWRKFIEPVEPLEQKKARIAFLVILKLGHKKTP